MGLKITKLEENVTTNEEAIAKLNVSVSLMECNVNVSGGTRQIKGEEVKWLGTVWSLWKFKIQRVPDKRKQI